MTAAPSIRNHTPHAPLPADDTAGAWVATANSEGGQVDKANQRADTIVHIGDTCDRWAKEAKEKVEKPWWKVW